MTKLMLLVAGFLISSPFSLFSKAFANEAMATQTCFPVGRARHDRECYSFDKKTVCLKTDDIFSCAWGQRRDDPISDDELLVCETSRCEELPDDHDIYGNL